MKPSLPPSAPTSPLSRARVGRSCLGLRFGFCGALLGALCACGAGTRPPPKAGGDWQVLAPAAWDIDPATVRVPDIGRRG